MDEMPTKTDAPKYVHDCDVCVFLGNFEDMDLYVCRGESGGGTYVARQSDQDSDYISGVAFVGKVPAITRAYELAKDKGLNLGS